MCTPSSLNLVVPGEDRSIAILVISQGVGANREELGTNGIVLVKGSLVLGGGEVVVCAPVRDLGGVPDSSEVLDVVDHIRADVDETVALVKQALELPPVSVLGETVTGNPALGTGAVETVPDGGEAGLVVLGVAGDVDELVALADVLVEGGLVLRVGEAVASHPGAVETGLVPDGGVPRGVVDGVAVHELEAEALVGVLVEGGLVAGGVEAVAGNPLGAVVGLFPDGGEAGVVVDGVAVDPGETVALVDEVVEGGLVLGVGQAVAGLPGVLGGRDDDALGLRDWSGGCQSGEGRDEEGWEGEHLDGQLRWFYLQ